MGVLRRANDTLGATLPNRQELIGRLLHALVQYQYSYQCQRAPGMCEGADCVATLLDFPPLGPFKAHRYPSRSPLWRACHEVPNGDGNGQPQQSLDENVRFSSGRAPSAHCGCPAQPHLQSWHQPAPTLSALLYAITIATNYLVSSHILRIL